MEDSLIQTSQLTKNFDGLTAVDKVNLEISKGEMRSIIGPNGAGKTTLLNLLTGDLRPSSGNIVFKGHEITDWPTWKISRFGMIRSYQITSVFPDLSVFENIRLAAQARTSTYNFFQDFESLRDVKKRTEELLNYFDMSHLSQKPVSVLSHGEERYIELGMSLAAEPEVLLLDEPTAGLTPSETLEMTEMIRVISSDLTTILIEHDMDMVMSISDWITVLHNGAILAEGSPDEIEEDEEVKEVYLGY